VKRLTEYPRKLVVEYWDCGSGHLHRTEAEARGCTDQPDPRLDLPIDDLELTVRAANGLKAENICTVSDLLVYLRKYQLRHIPHIGRGTEKQILSVLESRGLWPRIE
jgi:DNA-directed RNA polymerase alpha subunit